MSQSELPDFFERVRRQGRGTRFIRTCRVFDASDQIRLGESAILTPFSHIEAGNLAAFIRKKHAFSRIGADTVYTERAHALGGHTVVDVWLPDMVDAETLRREVELLERCFMASVVLEGRRASQHRHAASGPPTGHDLHLTPNEYGIRPKSSKTQQRQVLGIPVGSTAGRRFARVGGPSLITFAGSDTKLGRSVRRGLEWLWQSRLESDLVAALVKTSTALECILVHGEGPTRAISEGGALLLSSVPDERRRLAAALRRLYKARSNAVHGNAIDTQGAEVVIEFGDRAFALLAFTLARSGWTRPEELIAYCSAIKWGEHPALLRPKFGRALGSVLERLEATRA